MSSYSLYCHEVMYAPTITFSSLHAEILIISTQHAFLRLKQITCIVVPRAQVVLNRISLRCGHSLVGKARPCQGRDRGFESRCPLEASSSPTLYGGLAKRLGSGLQSRLDEFDSRTHLSGVNLQAPHKDPGGWRRGSALP